MSFKERMHKLNLLHYFDALSYFFATDKAHMIFTAC